MALSDKLRRASESTGKPPWKELIQAAIDLEREVDRRALLSAGEAKRDAYEYALWLIEEIRGSGDCKSARESLERELVTLEARLYPRR